MTLRALFVLGFGLAPLWGAGVLIWLVGRQSRSADYWNVAPWLLVYALPLCGVTLAIALATVGAFSLAGGSRARKLGVALASFVLLTGAVALLAHQHWRERNNLEKAKADDEARVVSFVAAHPAVHAAAGRPGRVWSGAARVDRHGLPIEYDVHVGVEPPLFAIVSVVRTAGETAFSLRCITTVPLGRRESHADWCGAGTLPLGPDAAKGG
ncbi:MAG: hypothetical protein N2544_13505 [Burkholderiales bacterium]|nr:hypothetical protein [Burkholderiales bacterium]